MTSSEATLLASKDVAARLRAAVRRLRPELVTLLCDLVQIPSINPELAVGSAAAATGGEAEVNGVVARAMETLDMEVASITSEPGRPNIVGVLAGTGGGRSLGFNGHIDTVPAGRLSDWRTDPWDAAVRDGRVFGLGACDNKAGIVAALGAVAALRQAGVSLAGNLMIQSVCGEESGGSAGTLPVLDAGFIPDACIVVEPSGRVWNGSHRSDVQPVGPSSLALRIRIRGKQTHGSLRHEWLYPGGRPYIGVNALELVVDVIKELQRLERAWAFDKRHPLFPPGKFTIHPGFVHSGPTDSSGPYYPTQSATVEYEIYCPPEADLDEVRQEVEGFVTNWSASDPWLRENPPEFEWFLEWPGFSVAKDHELVKTIAAAHSELHYGAVGVSGFLASCDATHLNRQGIPSVVFGPGELGAAHAANESVAVADVMRAVCVYSLAATRWCGLA